MSITSGERAEFTSLMNQACDEIDSLRAEIARLKADADRLDMFIRLSSEPPYSAPYITVKDEWTLQPEVAIGGHFKTLRDALDAAIAAMKADK